MRGRLCEGRAIRILDSSETAVTRHRVRRRMCANITTDPNPRAMARKKADVDVILLLLRGVDLAPRQLSGLLRQAGVPRSTFYYWRKRLAAAREAPAGVVRKLELENRRLRKQMKALELDLVIAKEALGKPWRRLLADEPPSDGPSVGTE